MGGGRYLWYYGPDTPGEPDGRLTTMGPLVSLGPSRLGPQLLRRVPHRWN